MAKILDEEGIIIKDLKTAVEMSIILWYYLYMTGLYKVNFTNDDIYNQCYLCHYFYDICEKPGWNEYGYCRCNCPLASNNMCSELPNSAYTRWYRSEDENDKKYYAFLIFKALVNFYIKNWGK